MRVLVMLTLKVYNMKNTVEKKIEYRPVPLSLAYAACVLGAKPL